MPKPRQKKISVFAACVGLLFFLVGCEYSSDGPLKPSSGNLVHDGQGFFLEAALDSNHFIHLASDTLFLGLQSIWSFSNCALKSIDVDYEKEGSVLWISPTINIHATEDECAAPLYRPDTVLKLNLDEEILDGVGQINVRNDNDDTLDTIVVRRGSFVTDTFRVYIDSLFANPRNYPLKTKETKKGEPIASVLAVLDSLTPRVFYWRTMKSTCTHRVDMCDDVVADTIYPTSWNINDTNLVPVHYSCADSSLIYCINTKWENDTASLGSLQERPDTIWSYSTYYVENIPECSTFDGFSSVSVTAGSTANFIRKMFVPGEEETFCGPSSSKKKMFYKLPGRMVLDNDSVKVVDDLLSAWDKASVAPDTLIAKDE